MLRKKHLTDRNGQIDDYKVLHLLANADKYEYITVMVIPLDIDWQYINLSCHYEYHEALILDNKEMDWTTFTIDNNDRHTILNEIREPYKKWLNSSREFVNIVWHSTLILIHDIGFLIYNYIHPMPLTITFDEQLLGDSFAICDESYMGCIKCRFWSKNKVKKAVEWTNDDINKHKNCAQHQESQRRLD